MKLKIPANLVGATAAVLVLLALTDVANAGTADQPCVSNAEYRAVNPHLGGSAGTRAQIRQVFGTGGTVYRQTHYTAAGMDQYVQWRKYDRCGSRMVYRIEYHKFGQGPYRSYWG